MVSAVTELDIPVAGTARVHVLHEGYVGSHHHPDHTVNAALFPNARIHDHGAPFGIGARA